MSKSVLPVAAVLALVAFPALAGHCPKDVKKIDAAFSGGKVSAANMTKVKALRDKGAGLHKSKQHGGSLEALHEALKIGGIKH